MTLALPEQTDLDLIFGAENIRLWATVDNDNDTTKREAKVVRAIQDGYNYIVGRIANRYDVSSFVALPDVLFQLIVKRAAIELYTSPRGLVDGDPQTAQIASISLEVESKLDQILAGQLVLLDISDELQPIQTPNVNNSTAHFRSDGLKMRPNYQHTGEPCVDDWTGFYWSH